MRLMRVTGAAGGLFAIAGGVCALKMGTGCASVLGIESDRHVAASVVDAGSDASVYPPGWECLGAPDLVADAGTVKLRFQLLDATNATNGANGGTPIVGATVNVCHTIDFSCANPFDVATTDDAGDAVLVLPSGFAGYYEVPSTPNFNPSLFFRPPQYVNQTQPQGVADSMDIAAAGAVANVTQDPTLAFAIVSANDCSGNSAGGIQFSVGNPQANETVVYLVNSVPSPTATQTDAVTGSALIFNVPVAANNVGESLVVSAFFAQSGGFIQKITGLGRAGYVSYVAIEPDQSTRNPF